MHAVFPDAIEGCKLGTKDHLIEWKKPQRKPVSMTALEYAGLP
ncbi:MAG: hypothetical protein WCP96_11590 [Methylococcaceae bacterium]